MEDHLAGQPESSVALYRQFVRLVEACGPFSYAVSKTSITFKVTNLSSALNVATMSHGLAALPCNSLKQEGNDCDTARHGARSLKL